MTKSLKQIQEENKKIILESIHNCDYQEALQKEIGFGCKILVERKYYSEGNTKFKWGEGLIVVDTSVYLDDINLKEGIIYTDKFGSEKIIEIIGKPLTLNRVLNAIPMQKIYDRDTYYREFLLSIQHHKGEDKGLNIAGYYWDLRKETLEEQSEETQRAINKILAV